MNKSLDTYQRKRNFEETPEPSGAPQPRRSASRAASTSGKAAAHALEYCIQKHDATRLHYDFRLEWDGTLKSWAVPKGPSLDPKIKRLAVHVEDHPLDYASFEGHIPTGHYGAGDVIVWDRGRWIPEGDPSEGLRKGRLTFSLEGEKLNGQWHLVRTHLPGKQEQWFLIKSNDGAARPEADYDIVEALPDSVLSDRAIVPKRRQRAPAAVAVTSQAAPSNPAAAVDTAVKAVSRSRMTKISGKIEAAAKTAKTPKTATAATTAKTATAPLRLDGAVAAPLPETLQPQLATLIETVPDGDWRYEIKFDGYRILAQIDAGKVRLFTRNGHDWTARLPRQAKALASLGLASAWLDGEVVVANAEGLPDFQALQNAFDEQRGDAIVYYLFDIPYLQGQDLRRVALETRRAALREVLHTVPARVGDEIAAAVRYSEDFAEAGETMLESVCRLRLEGLIGKRAGSPYAGRRNSDWIKLKCKHRQEFVIVGFTEPKGGRQALGALLLGLHDKDSGVLRYAGKVGTGFNDATLRTLHARLQPLETKRPAVQQPPTGAEARGVHWVEASLLAEVAFAEMTRDGIIRHAVFHGLRNDKPAAAITAEVPMPAAAAAAQTPSRAAVKTRRGRATKSTATPHVAGEDVDLSKLRITHPDRIIDAASGATKMELAQYYARVAGWILPQLQGRPVALVRAPDGVGGELFFQKHAEKLAIPDVRMLDKSFAGQPVMMLDNALALLGAVQMSTIELHTWNARTPSIHAPDRFVLDLDPDPSLPWKRMVEATQLTLTVLDEIGLTAFLKTSGGKGIHIVVPLTPKDSWEDVKAFSHAIVKHLAKLLPSRFAAVSGPKNRVGKIFVDYLRNGQGATTVAAFSARAREGLPVSVPIAYEEVADIKSASQWNIRNVHKRLDAQAHDPWARYAQIQQTITADMRRRLGIM